MSQAAGLLLGGSLVENLDVLAADLFCTLSDCLMLKFQVEDVNAKFDALEKLKSNNWEEEEKKTKKFIKKSKAKVLC